VTGWRRRRATFLYSRLLRTFLRNGGSLPKQVERLDLEKAKVKPAFRTTITKAAWLSPELELNRGPPIVLEIAG
jgi:hypothetical protein